MPRSSHLLIVCLALVALGLGIVVWRQQIEISRLARHQSVAADQAASRPTPARRALALPPRPASSVPVWNGEEGEIPAQFAGSAKPAKPGSVVAWLFDDPQFVRALTVHQEGALDARFATLFRRLNLNAQQLAEFKRLLVEKDNALLDFALVNQKTGGGLSAESMRAGILAAEVNLDNAIRASLGTERYAVYSEYLTTLPERITVTRLERRLSYSETPLEPAQAESLVNILAQHPAPPAEAAKVATLSARATESGPVPVSNPPPAAVSSNAVVQAQAVLTPPQVAALQQIQAEMEAGVIAAGYINRNVPAEAPHAAGELSWVRFLLQ